MRWWLSRRVYRFWVWRVCICCPRCLSSADWTRFSHLFICVCGCLLAFPPAAVASVPPAAAPGRAAAGVAGRPHDGLGAERARSCHGRGQSSTQAKCPLRSFPSPTPTSRVTCHLSERGPRARSAVMLTPLSRGCDQPGTCLPPGSVSWCSCPGGLASSPSSARLAFVLSR